MAAQYIPIKRISLLDTPIKAEKLDGSLFTTENQAHEFIISVRKNGVKQTVTGSVSGKFIRANGTTIFLQGSIVDGDAVVRLHQDCYNVQGRFTFNIFNTQSGVTTCIYSAVGKMDMGSTETVIDAGDVVPDISDVVAKQEEMTQVIADARAATSAASQAATEGENKFVRFDASQTLTEAQKSTARTNIDSPSNAEINDLKSAIDVVEGTLFDEGPTTSPIEWEQGALYASSGGKLNNVKRLRTNAFSLTDEFAIAPKDGYAILLYAYDGVTKAYIGIWNGTSFEKSTHFMQSAIPAWSLPKTNLYKLVLRYIDDDSITELPVSDYINCIIKKEHYLEADDYHPEIAKNAAKDVKNLQNGFLSYFDCEIGGISSSGNKNSVTNVVRSKTAVKFDVDTFIRCNDIEYNYAVWKYTAAEISSDNYGNWWSGETAGTFLLKANEYYVITIGKRVKETVDSVDTYASKVEVWSPLYLETMRKYEMKSFSPMGNTRRKIIGHQGNSLHYPGNTIPAFEEAGAGGVWGIETDINVTSDGYLVCIHNTTLDATTNGTGNVVDHTLAEIRELHIKNYDDLQVPTLEEFLSICKVYGCVPVLELKNVAQDQTGISKLLSTVKEYGFENTAIILCSIYSIRYVQCISPKNPCIFIIDPTDLETWIPRTGRYFNTNVTMASGTYTVTHEIISQLHNAGFTVCVGGVNTVEAIKNYFAMGADAVSSDFITTY